MTLLKINRLLHIYISIVPLKLGVDIQSQTKVTVWKPKNTIWPPGGHFESAVAENQQASAYDHHQHVYEVWNWNSKANLTYTPETMPPTESRNQKIQYGHQVAILKMTLLKINRPLPIYISIVPLKFEVDIQSQSKVRVWKPKKSNMAARRPFWKWRRWKSIGFCLWPPSTCIWNLKLKFQSKLDLCSGNHVVYRRWGIRICLDDGLVLMPVANCV